MKTKDLETMRDDLINYYINLSHKHDRHAQSTGSVYRMNVHMNLSNRMRRKASEMVNKEETYINKLHNDIFNYNKD